MTYPYRATGVCLLYFSVLFVKKFCHQEFELHLEACASGQQYSRGTLCIQLKHFNFRNRKYNYGTRLTKNWFSIYFGCQRSHDFDNCDVSFDNPKNSPCEVNNSIVTLDNPHFSPLGGTHRKLSVCVENMATAGRFAASSEEFGKCTYRHTI